MYLLWWLLPFMHHPWHPHRYEAIPLAVPAW